jgi:hypothetical protein
MVPETEATEYASHFLACPLKYLITDACDTKLEMAPAMNRASTRHKSLLAGILLQHVEGFRDAPPTPAGARRA